MCDQKLVAQPSLFRVEGPMCRWNLVSGESVQMRKPIPWLTNYPHLAQAFEQWRENASGTDPDEVCLAQEVFVDDVRGGVLRAERVKQARR